MENLHNYLPKDLVNIVEEYEKDRTNYDIVLGQYNQLLCKGVERVSHEWANINMHIFNFDSGCFELVLERILVSSAVYEHLIRLIKNDRIKFDRFISFTMTVNN